MKRVMISILALGLYGLLAIASNENKEKTKPTTERSAPSTSPAKQLSSPKENATASKLSLPQSPDAEGNRIVVKCVDEGASSYEKDQCKKQYKGKLLEFAGEIADIKEARVLYIMLGTGNFADVTFKTKIANEVKVGDLIRFEGKITFWGSGVLFSHEITAQKWNMIK